MTAEERMKSILEELEYDYIGYDNLHGDNGHGCRVIKEALEKQIPMKPKRYPASPKDIVLCPTCGSTFVTRNGFETLLMNYCNNCGQKMETEVW